MRVLWITGNFRPEVGGLQTYTEQLTSNLTSYLEVGIITGHGQAPAPGMPCHHFSLNNISFPRTTIEADKLLYQIAQIISGFRPEIIHLANAGVAVYSEAIPNAIPIVASVHGNDLTSPWQLWPRKEPKLAIQEGLARCRLILPVSKHTERYVMAAGITVPTEVLANGCDLNFFRPRPVDVNALLGRLGIELGPKLILSSGRLAPRKGHKVVLRALRKIGRPVHWIVAGDGPSLNDLRWEIAWRRLKGWVSLLGWVEPEMLLDFYNACDIFVLPTIEIRRGRKLDSEGFGLVFHEAAACGKPVIASNVSGCVEAVISGQTGLLVPPDDPSSLASALRQLIDDPSAALRLGRGGREHVLSLGGWPAVARSLITHYQRILETHATSHSSLARVNHHRIFG